MEKIGFLNAEWIWTSDNKTADQKIVIRKKFTLEDLPEKAIAYIACDTKFWLYINSHLVVYEGGVFRESLKGCGYAEKVDIASFLNKGENILAALVWFYGNGGRNNINSGEAGFIFSCEEIGLFSDSDFKVINHPAYIKTMEPYPSYLFGGENTGFDARRDIGDFTDIDFDDSFFENATEYPNNVWGDSYLSPLPLLKVFDEKEVAFDATEYGAKAKLPYAMTLSVCFSLEAEGGEIIDVRTDRYCVNGGPGDEINKYNCHRIEYIAKKGINEYKCPMYLYGEELLLSFPASVKLTGLSFIESGYNTKQTGDFKTDNALFNRLIDKSIRTLYVCMRNNFMDCPDRERGQWIGDVSVQTPQVFYTYDAEAIKLLRKTISDFINLRKGNVLVGNVPGEYANEHPSQSLISISEYGLLGEYYANTQDTQVLTFAFEPIIEYLKLWQIAENGLLQPRNGHNYWFDHLWNVDKSVLENCIYLSAVKYARKISEIIDRHDFDAFLDERIEILTENIEKHFWKGKYYASGDFVDDRANAIAVLCGVCPKERYELIRKILISVFNSTPYMERFVLTALCEMGYVKDAFNRMMSRYYNLAVNENSTLWEDFYILGTKNHAWTGSPLEIAFKYILGLKIDAKNKTFTIDPAADIFGEIITEFKVGEKAVKLHLKEVNGKMVEVCNG